MIIFNQQALLKTRPIKNVATKRPNTHQKIELKNEEGRLLTHVYQQSRFTSNRKLSSHPIREKRKKKGRVLKYFQVENDVMSFIELRGKR